MPKNTFRKHERLNSKKAIESLLSGGQTEFLYPFRIYWTYHGYATSFVKGAFSVPKRVFKKAVDRNTIKRRMREAFRMNKHELIKTCKDHDITLHFIIVYVAAEKLHFDQIELKIKDLIHVLAHAIYEKNC